MGGAKSGKVGFAMGSCSAFSRVGRQEDVARVEPIPTPLIGGCVSFMRPMKTFNFENEISRVSVPRRTDRQDTRADGVGAGHGGSLNGMPNDEGTVFYEIA